MYIYINVNICIQKSTHFRPVDTHQGAPPRIWSLGKVVTWSLRKFSKNAWQVMALLAWIEVAISQWRLSLVQ